MPANPRGGGCFLLVWLLGWSSVVLVFDGHLCWALFQQSRAATFPTTEGIITRSEIKSDGGSYRFDVAYDYTVAGRQYTGTRYSYAEMGTNSRAWHTIRDELPVGSRVSVAYNPNDPSESLLRPGFTGFHLTIVWFLTPFNVIMIGGWVYLAHFRRPAFDPTDPRSVAPTATGWRVRLPDSGRWGLFGACLLTSTFVGTFVWACGCGFNPPIEFGGGGYVVVVAVAAWIAVRHTPPWLEVNEIERVLRLPTEIPFAAIRDIVVTHEETHDPEGARTQYHCELVRTDTPDGAPPTRVTSFWEPAPAEALAAWLRERVGLTPA